jgi:hypothetical protein
MAVTAMRSRNANKRKLTLPGIEPVNMYRARRWTAQTLFLLASSVLRGSIGLYERHQIHPIVLRMALLTVRILERTARIVLFGYRSIDGRKCSDGRHGQ